MGRFSSRTTTLRMEGLNNNGMTIGPGPGDFTFGNTNKENTEKIRVDDRGRYDCHIDGTDLEQEWSVTIGVQNQSLTDATAARVTDFIEQAGIFDPSTGTSATTTVSPNTEIWAFRTIVTMTLGAATATWTLPNCLGNYSFAEALEGSTLSVSGMNNGKITRT